MARITACVLHIYCKHFTHDLPEGICCAEFIQPTFSDCVQLALGVGWCINLPEPDNDLCPAHAGGKAGCLIGTVRMEGVRIQEFTTEKAN